MKKNLFSLFSVVSLLIFLVACSDSNENESVERWKEISKTYEGNMLEVKLNTNTVILSGKSVELTTTSATTGTLTFNNVLPDAPAHTMDVSLEGLEKFVITGETTVGNASVSVEGLIDENNMCSLNLLRKIDTPVTGNWNMLIQMNGETPSAALYVNAKTGDPLLDVLFGLVESLLGPLITSKVENVTATLGEDGLFDVNWTTVGEEEPTGLPPYLTAFLRIYYVTDGDKLFLAIDKNYIELIQDLLPLLDDLGFDLDMDKILPLLTDLGGYYAIPLHFMQEGDQTTFYLTKELLVPLIDLLAPLLLADLDEAIVDLINNILAAIPNAEQLDFGMIFEKASK